MTHIEAIQTHIEASSPCTLAGVMSWACNQGFGGSKAIQAIDTLKQAKIIDVLVDDEGTLIVELGSNWTEA